MVDTYFAINPLENWPSYLDIENEILTYPIASTTNTVVGDSTEESKSKITNEAKKEQESEILSSQQEDDENFKQQEHQQQQLQKSKRIQKREQAKIRQKQMKQKQIDPMITENQEDTNLKNINFLSSKQKEIDELNELLNKTTDKKMKQKIRNRISAQNSRDKKKAYINYLEAENQDLRQQISQLIYEKQQLENNNLENSLQQQQQQIKQSINLHCPHCNCNLSDNLNLLGDDELNLFNTNNNNNNQSAQTNYGKILLSGFGIFMILGVISIAFISSSDPGFTQLNQKNSVNQEEILFNNNQNQEYNLFDFELDESIEIEELSPDIIQFVINQKQNQQQQNENQSTAIAPINQNYNLTSLINFSNLTSISRNTKNLFSQYYYQLLQINKFRSDAQLNLDQIKNDENSEKLRLEFPTSKKFLSKDSEEQQVINLKNALVSYNYKEKKNFSTLFCAEPYLYENNQQVFQNSEQLLQKSQYLHLLMPKDHLQQFAISYNDQLVINPFSEFSQGFQSDYYENQYSNNNENSSKTKMVEIVCKIKYMREV